MGVFGLWSILEPYFERKPLLELEGKVVAIDLAGWVCESQNVVDYLIQPRNYLKNLFFRTCYLLLANVTPVFILEGEAPKLKHDVIKKRNLVQFPGVRVRKGSQTEDDPNSNKTKGRTRFNYVLKQCQDLLTCLGVQCVQGPGEAEAYGALLNSQGLIDGIISQDSDCFAYGGLTVFRNFSVAKQGAVAAQGGMVDVYDMNRIKQHMDFGQHKIITMALMCGCDYCPGIEGVGKDAVKKLFQRYTEANILENIRLWRADEQHYKELERTVEDKDKCNNCGHFGKTASHTRKGCFQCGTSSGCDSSKWKELRLGIKSEISIRQKALADPNFPPEDVIAEFLSQPSCSVEQMDLEWKQPNLVKFVKIMGKLLEWDEIYSFQKVLPLFTRWLLLKRKSKKQSSLKGLLEPSFIKKKRNPKGVPSYEIIWKDDQKCFDGLVTDEQFQKYISENPGGLDTLWTTVEPIPLVETAFPELVESYLASKVKPKKPTKNPRKKKLEKTENTPKDARKKPKPNDSLNNFNDMNSALSELEAQITKKQPAAQRRRKNGLVPLGVKRIDEFFKNTEVSLNISDVSILRDLPANLEGDEENVSDLSDIISGIVGQQQPILSQLKGHNLHFSTRINSSLDQMDDIDLLIMKKQKPKRDCINSSTPHKSEK